MVRIRSRRPRPGLRAQHLQALRACASLCSGQLEGDEVGSQEIYYQPGPTLEGGDFHWDVGTAGSTTMIAFTVLPVAVFAPVACRFTITGGLFQDFAPSAFHMQKVLLPLLETMGVRAQLEVVRPGYYPEGKGILRMTVAPGPPSLAPLSLEQQGTIREIRGIALASHLERERVAERIAVRCRELLEREGWSSTIRITNDGTAVRKGAALVLWGESDTGCRWGADRAGKKGRRSEDLASHAVGSILEDLRSGACTDRYTADQLILFCAVARGTSQYRIPRVTEHVQSNRWLVQTILGVESRLSGNLLTIEGGGLQRGVAQLGAGVVK